MEREIYYIKFKKLDSIPINFEKNIANILNEKDLESIYFGTGNDDQDFMIMELDRSIYERLVELVEENNMTHIYKSISSNLIENSDFYNGNTDLEIFKEDDMYKDFIKNNITIDDILDKISLNGIESLTDIDKDILNSFK